MRAAFPCPSASPGCLAFAALLILWAGACSRPPEPPRLCAGVFAVDGTVRVESAREVGFRRTARAGMGLFSDQILTVEPGARVILESLGTRFVSLGEGRHRLDDLRALNTPPAPKRLVQRVDPKGEVEPVEVGPLIATSRYEPLPSAPVPKSPLEGLMGDSDMSEGMAFFFLPASARPAPSAPEVPPWKAREHRVRPLGRKIETAHQASDDARLLIRASGLTAIEFRDHATAFADRLPLPIDLGDVARVVAVKGDLTLSLPSGERRFKSGSEVLVSHADAAPGGASTD